MVWVGKQLPGHATSAGNQSPDQKNSKAPRDSEVLPTNQALTVRVSP